ncbi:MAG: hypothetical protein JW941_04545 [Candidatus Coatesbacteria bacterium]|nr:hypothetical protein [Candidatus Coatesbacteria bacterium]
MTSNPPFIIRNKAIQTIILMASLWLLGLIQLNDVDSQISFQLFFAMLAPHLFSGTAVFAALLLYLPSAAFLMQLNHPASSGMSLVLFAAHSLALLAATFVSVLSIRGSTSRTRKLVFGLYYILTLYMAISYAYRMRASSFYLSIWPILLILLPMLIMWRLRQFLPFFWKTIGVAIVYIPLSFIIRLAISCGLAADWRGLMDRIAIEAAFQELVLPLGPYVLMALIASVILTFSQGRHLHPSAVEFDGAIKVRELEDSSEPDSNG